MKEASAFARLHEPESVGMSTARLERLRDKFRSYVDTGRFPGVSIGVARFGRPVFRELYGYQRVEDKTPMTDHALFRLYSMTKQLTALMMMVLYEEGRFQLYEALSKFIPEYSDVKVIKSIENGNVVTEELRRPITLYDLFLHTSGIGSVRLYPPELKFDRSQIMNVKQSMEVGVRNLAKMPLLCHPGEGFAYGHSHDLLGRVAEVITGKRLDILMNEKLFAPLGLRNTHFVIPERQRSLLADAYAPGPNGTLRNVTQGILESGDPLNSDAVMFSGGSGIVSTTSDMFRVAQLLLNGGELDGSRLFSPITVEFMLRDHTPHPPKSMHEIYGDPRFAGFGKDRHVNLLFATISGPEKRTVMESYGAFTYGGLGGTLVYGDPATGVAAVMMMQVVTDPLSSTHYDEFKILSSQAVTESLRRPN